MKKILLILLFILGCSSKPSIIKVETGIPIVEVDDVAVTVEEVDSKIRWLSPIDLDRIGDSCIVIKFYGSNSSANEIIDLIFGYTSVIDVINKYYIPVQWDDIVSTRQNIFDIKITDTAFMIIPTDPDATSRYGGINFFLSSIF